MQVYQIMLHSMRDVEEFVNQTSRFPGEVDVTTGRYVVNGKSIMGLYSIDLAHPVTVIIQGSQEETDALLSSIKPFLVEGSAQEGSKVLQDIMNNYSLLWDKGRN